MHKTKWSIVNRIVFFLFVFLLGNYPMIGYAKEAESTNSSTQTINFTEEERAYITQHPVLTIAMDTSWIPYCFYDESNNEVAGILPNSLRTITENAEIGRASCRERV